MGLWEVTDEVMSQAERSQTEEAVPSYAHISHRALKDIPKECTNPYNCKVRALAFNNNHKVRVLLMQLWGNHDQEKYWSLCDVNSVDIVESTFKL